MSKITEEIIPNEEITKVWQHANFGDTPKREVILDTLKKIAQGWGTGHTAMCIVNELGLTDKRNGHIGLSDKGLEYLIAASQFTQPTIEQEGKSKESLELYMEALLTWIGDNHIQFTDGEWYHKDDADGDNPIPEKELVSQFVFRNPIPLESIKSQPSPAPLPNGFTVEDIIEKAYAEGNRMGLAGYSMLSKHAEYGLTQFLNTLKR